MCDSVYVLLYLLSCLVDLRYSLSVSLLFSCLTTRATDGWCRNNTDNLHVNTARERETDVVSYLTQGNM